MSVRRTTSNITIPDTRLPTLLAWIRKSRASVNCWITLRSRPMPRFRIWGRPFHPKIATRQGKPKTRPACNQSWALLLRKIVKRRPVRVANWEMNPGVDSFPSSGVPEAASGILPPHSLQKRTPFPKGVRHSGQRESVEPGAVVPSSGAAPGRNAAECFFQEACHPSASRLSNWL